MFKPMLAKNIKIKNLKVPVMVSNKMEGVRAEFTPEGLRTRPMKKFGNSHVELFFADLSAYCRANRIYMEGEIYIHGMDFNNISSICRRQHHPDTDQLRLYIFDMWDPSFPDALSQERYGRLCNIVDHLQIAPVFVARQTFMTIHDRIEEKYELAIEDGYEGLCFKCPTQKYKPGRPTVAQQFMRIKPEDTWEGKIIEIVEMQENLVESEYNELGLLSKKQDKDMKAGKGMAAVAVCTCIDFPDDVIRVTLSRGLTDADRAEIWINREQYLGRNLRWVGIPVRGMLPRSPRFDVWRTDLD